MENYQGIATEVYNAVGGNSNVASFTHCMTRLRLTLVDNSKANVEKVRDIDGVIRVVDEEGFHVVLGPGAVTKVAEHFGQILESAK